MGAFHSRAGRNAASCGISNGVKNGVRNGNIKNGSTNGSATNGGITNGTTERPGNGLLVEIPPVHDVRLRKLLQLIESDPLGKIQDWAVALNLSQSHLQHLFKEATGCGLGHLLTEKRLQRAADLLASTNMSIKEISSAVGYEHASSFTRAFERRFEQGPREYRMGNSAMALADRRVS